MNRPFVFINVAMTADGKIDTFQRRGSAISSARDKERVDRLRAESDAVLVGESLVPAVCEQDLEETLRISIQNARRKAS